MTRTSCRLFPLSPDGVNTSPSKWFVFDDPAERTGDGEAEAEFFLESSNSNGYSTIYRPDIIVQGCDVSNVKVYELRDNAFPDCIEFFGLAVVDFEPCNTNSY